MKALHNHPPSISQSMSEATPRTTETRGEQSNTGLYARDEARTRRDERTKRAAVTWWSPLKLRRTRQEIDDKATRPRPQAGSRRRWRWRATSSDRVAATAGATDDEREAGGGEKEPRARERATKSWASVGLEVQRVRAPL